MQLTCNVQHAVSQRCTVPPCWYMCARSTLDRREIITVHVYTQVLHCLHLQFVAQSTQNQPLPLEIPLQPPPTATGSMVGFNHKANLKQQMQPSRTLFWSIPHNGNLGMQVTMGCICVSHTLYDACLVHGIAQWSESSLAPFHA